MKARFRLHPEQRAHVEKSRLHEVAAEIRRTSSIARSIPEAQRRQFHMLPKPPALANYDFDCRYIPCDEVSGDFYDFIKLSDGRLGISIGDVSGHGIEAAMVMGMAKKALNIFAHDEPSPKRVLELTNQSLSTDLLDGTFVSAAYGILNVEKRQFVFARAGNNPPFLVNPARNPAVTELKPAGMAIGVDKSCVRFHKIVQELAVQLRPGDLVFQYTDGLVEATSPSVAALTKNASDEFGAQRLHELLLANIGMPVPMLLGVAEGEVRRFAGGQLNDDVTLIAFRVLR